MVTSAHIVSETSQMVSAISGDWGIFLTGIKSFALESPARPVLDGVRDRTHDQNFQRNPQLPALDPLG
jgi:hypothetical protein